MKDIWPQILQAVLPTAIIVFTSCTTWVSVHLVGFIKAKWGGTKKGQILGEAATYLGSIVADLEATVKPSLLSYASTGKLSAEDGAKLRQIALTRFQALLGSTWKGEAMKVLGLAAPEFETWLGGMLEQLVTKFDGPKVASVGQALAAVAQSATPVPVPAAAPSP